MMQERFTVQELRERFDFEPATGVVRWRRRDLDVNGWNKRWAGKIAGTKCSNGYLKVNTSRGPIHLHRIAWALAHGEWPTEYIDHINGDKQDNRPENLRDIPKQENHRNMRLFRTNTSGYAGVTYCKSSSLWKATIKENNRAQYLGSFAEIQDAVDARRAAERRIGFHPNHGRR